MPRPDAWGPADRHSDNRIVFEAANASRWPISSIAPRCALAFADGNRVTLTPTTRAARTGLDDTGHVSTAVPPGGRIAVSLRTERIRHGSPVVRADCEFDISVPWWIWASEMPRDRRS